MANKQRGYVDIELNGEVHKLRFDVNALAELEDALGIPVSQISSKKLGIKELRAMLWAGLLHEDPKRTQKYVGSWMDLDDISSITDKITEALALAFGKTPEEFKQQAEDEDPN